MRSRPSIRLVLLVSTLVAPGSIRAEEPPKLLPRDAAGELFPPLPPDAPKAKADPARNRGKESSPLTVSFSEAAPAAGAGAPTKSDATVMVPVVVAVPASSADPTGAADVRKMDAAAKTDSAATAAKADTNPDASAKPADAVSIPTPAAIAKATTEEAGKMFAAVEARLKALDTPEAKAKAENKAIREILEERKHWLLEWRTAAKEHHEAEHPESSPERQAADCKAELEKCKTLLDQAAKDPDAPLPDLFRAASSGSIEARLAEIKEAIDAARKEVKDRTAELEALRAEASRAANGDNAALRARRDKLHQDLSTLTARRGEREEAVAKATSPEARDLAAERLANFEWEARAVAERLDAQEARIALAARKLDLSTLFLQASGTRVRLSKKILERMEWHYSTIAEAQRKALDRAVAQEQSRAALANDPVLRHRARKNADLLELESQVVAYEKASAATDGGLSLQEQKALADAAEEAFAKLKKMLEDDTLSPLEVLRLKNEYRRIGPERDRVTRTDLVASTAELTMYENALSDAEVDLVNDSRDDRFEADSLLEKIEPARRPEAIAMLDDLESKHRGLLNRRCNILQKLAVRAEETHTAVLRRIRLLDQQNAFIRTHIFWVRDAEPMGKSTLIRARGEAGRLIRALVGLAGHALDRKQWGETSIGFLAAATIAVFLPLPLWFGRRWLDRRRLAPGT
jgi:hypothetical protein